MEIQHIDITTLTQEKGRPNGRLIDVREHDEYVAGHVPGAALYPLSAIEQWLPTLDPTVSYDVICRAGKRSLIACEAMQAAGYQCRSVDGGTLAWPEALETGE